MPDSPLSASDLAPRQSQHVCSLCGKEAECRLADSLRHSLVRQLEAKGLEPDEPNASVCTACVSSVMSQHARLAVKGEGSKLSDVELEIAERASEIADEIEQGVPATFAHRAADAVTRIGGSWVFVLSFISVILIWIVINTVMLSQDPFDPYPYILLNLVLSSISSIQAPIILMSQSRMAQIDRIRATEDFRINLKAELEIATLHQKIDQLMEQQQQLLAERRR